MLRTVRGSHVRTGDVVFFLGTPHLVSELAPYPQPVGRGERIARDGAGWAVALSDSVYVTVDRPAAHRRTIRRDAARGGA